MKNLKYIISIISYLTFIVSSTSQTFELLPLGTITEDSYPLEFCPPTMGKADHMDAFLSSSGLEVYPSEITLGCVMILGPGTYTLTMSSNGVASTMAYTFIATPLSIGDPPTFTICNERFCPSIIGGTAPYTIDMFTWPIPSFQVTDLCPGCFQIDASGDYLISVTDASGTNVTSVVTITYDPCSIITANIPLTQFPSWCSSTFKTTVDAGCETITNMQVQDPNGNFLTGASMNLNELSFYAPVPNGLYTVTLTTDKGCTVDIAVTPSFATCCSFDPANFNIATTQTTTAVLPSLVMGNVPIPFDVAVLTVFDDMSCFCTPISTQTMPNGFPFTPIAACPGESLNICVDLISLTSGCTVTKCTLITL